MGGRTTNNECTNTDCYVTGILGREPKHTNGFERHLNVPVEIIRPGFVLRFEKGGFVLFMVSNESETDVQ